MLPCIKVNTSFSIVCYLPAESSMNSGEEYGRFHPILLYFAVDVNYGWEMIAGKGFFDIKCTWNGVMRRVNELVEWWWEKKGVRPPHF